MQGAVSDQGVPFIDLEIAGRHWMAIIDTGFNGDLELPADLQANLTGQFVGRATSLLAAGQTVEEDVYLVEFPLDDEIVLTEATFVAGSEILVGTRMLRRHRVRIDFPHKTVVVERV